MCPATVSHPEVLILLTCKFWGFRFVEDLDCGLPSDLEPTGLSVRPQLSSRLHGAKYRRWQYVPSSTLWDSLEYFTWVLRERLLEITRTKRSIDANTGSMEAGSPYFSSRWYRLRNAVVQGYSDCVLRQLEVLQATFNDYARTHAQTRTILKIYYCVYKDSSRAPGLSLMNPIGTFTSYILNVCFNIIFLYTYLFQAASVLQMPHVTYYNMLICAVKSC